MKSSKMLEWKKETNKWIFRSSSSCSLFELFSFRNLILKTNINLKRTRQTKNHLVFVCFNKIYLLPTKNHFTFWDEIQVKFSHLNYFTFTWNIIFYFSYYYPSEPINCSLKLNKSLNNSHPDKLNFNMQSWNFVNSSCKIVFDK